MSAGAKGMNVSVKESVVIAAAPDAVWDYTQDWTRRSEWDPSVIAAEVLPGPERMIRARTRGGTFLIRYKLVDRPNRTSLAMTESTSRFFIGGGGSWHYAAEAGGTRLTQQNTLRLAGRFAWLAAWAIRWQLRRATRRALLNAKLRIEGMA